MNLKLRQLREARNLTQKQFAKEIKKAVGTIQSWEGGDSFPNAEAIWVMCEFFGTDPNDFLGWYDDHPRDDAPDLTRDEAEVVGCYRLSTPSRKAALLQTARDSAAMSKEVPENSVHAAEIVREAV